MGLPAQFRLKALERGPGPRPTQRIEHSLPIFCIYDALLLQGFGKGLPCETPGEIGTRGCAFEKNLVSS